MTNTTVCLGCGTAFDINLSACPECGFGDRVVTIPETIKVRDDSRTKGVSPDPKGGKPLEEFRLRTQFSWSTKREAIKKITTDRSRGKTQTRDEVWEKDYQGRWFKVHGHLI